MRLKARLKRLEAKVPPPRPTIEEILARVDKVLGCSPNALGPPEDVKPQALPAPETSRQPTESDAPEERAPQPMAESPPATPADRQAEDVPDGRDVAASVPPEPDRRHVPPNERSYRRASYASERHWKPLSSFPWAATWGWARGR
jgi:hypothetical protein